MSKKNKQPDSNASFNCPCQSGLLFQQCCQKFLSLSSLPETAEQLMRSRYSAYVLHNENYLLNTWHPKHRPEALQLQESTNQWLGLKIKATHKGQKNDHEGYVHFIARFKVNGKAHKLTENSFFEKINGQWFYTKGDIS